MRRKKEKAAFKPFEGELGKVSQVIGG